MRSGALSHSLIRTRLHIFSPNCVLFHFGDCEKNVKKIKNQPTVSSFEEKPLFAIPRTCFSQVEEVVGAHTCRATES